LPPELTVRTGGLLSPWILLLLAGVWIGGLLLAIGPLRRRWPTLAGQLAALGGLLLAHLLFFWRPLLTSAQVPRGGGDLNSFFFPLHAFSARAVQQGELPLWNPHLFSGMPHLANYQAGLLYPPNWVAYLLARPFTYGALEVMALSHYLVASLGAYALARVTFGTRRIPALVAGVVFPYSGFLVAHLGHYSMLSAAVWIPWIWLALERVVSRTSWRWAAVTAGFVFLLATGGHQQTVLYALAASAAWWLFWTVVCHGAPVRELWAGLAVGRFPPVASLWPVLRSPLADALRASLAVGSGMALAMPVLLPSLELARRSVRAVRLSYEQATEFSLQPVMLVHLLLPKLFGSNPTDYWGPFSSGEVWFYPGFVSLVLAGLSLALCRQPARWFLAAVGLVALLHAMGPATPVHGWVYRFLPFADLLRVPARSLLYVDLAIALLAALGLNDLLVAMWAGQARCARLVLRWVRWLLGVSLGALVLVVAPLFYRVVVGGQDLPARAVTALDGLNLLALWLGLTILWVWAVERAWVASRTAGLLALGLVVLDLFSATATFNPTLDDLTAGFRHPAVVARLREAAAVGEPVRMTSLTIRWQPSAAAVLGLIDAGGLYDPMQPADYASVFDLARRDLDSGAFDLLAARYLVESTDAGSPGSRFRLLLTTPEELALWENPRAMPRAWLAGRAETVDRETALRRVREPAFDPRQQLYLTGDVPPADPTASGHVEITSYRIGRIEIAVEATAPAYLVLADSYDPGWQATLDGRPVPVALADGIYRAVWVPAGRHQVVFSYRPPYLAAGLTAAVAGALAVVTMLVLGRFSRSPAEPGWPATATGQAGAELVG
jgi:hypothetical protein